MEGTTKAPFSPLLSPVALLGAPGSSFSHTQLPGVGGQGQTYTKASLGQSSEVLYQCASLLRGMAPLKYFTQHSRPTLVARTAEKQAGTDVSVSGGGGYLGGFVAVGRVCLSRVCVR